VILEREDQGLPALVRPELAVLLAYAKLQLKGALLASEMGEGVDLLPLLREYFPEDIRVAAGEPVLAGHPLARHIAATLLTNMIVDLHGGTGVLQMLQDTHRDPIEVARAWFVAWQVIDAESLLEEILAPDTEVPASVQYQWLLRASASIDRATRWLLANADLDLRVAELADWYGEPIAVLSGSLIEHLTERKRREVADRMAAFTADGMTGELAARFVALEYLDGLLPVAQLARETEVDAAVVGRIYFGLAGEVDFPWLQDCLAELPGTDRWQLRAARELMLDLEAARRRIVRRLLADTGAEGDAAAALAGFRTSCAPELERVERMLAELRDSEEAPGLPGLIVAVKAIQQQCDAWSDG
jgi:glutamate dehydrogenase